MEGWTQEEIATSIGMSQPSVVNLLSEFSELKKLIKNLLADGHPHLDVAERYNMPLQLAANLTQGLNNATSFVDRKVK